MSAPHAAAAGSYQLYVRDRGKGPVALLAG